MNAINSIRNYLPAFRIDTLNNILNKATMVAIPIIALVGASVIREVAANDYTDCIDACNRNGRDAHELAKLLCYTMCYFITK